MSESGAKSQIDREGGEPSTGYVSPSDIQDAIGIIYDDFTNYTDDQLAQLVLSVNPEYSVEAPGILNGAHGGTGVANTDKTITLSGNLTTSGAYNLTATLTGTTTITLPTSGTLATVTQAAAYAPPAGVINPYAGSSAPTDWLLCYGQAVSRTTYAVLFAVIGTTYGTGDGSTTFNLPDLRGRTVAGVDNMGGSDAARLDWANTLGTAGGTQTHTLTSGESGLPAHTHTQNSHNHTQDSHNHTQNSHNHTQDSHNHTQNAHSHTLTTNSGYYASIWGSSGGTTAGAFTYTVYNDPLLAANTTATNIATTATNQAATATNIAATATNQAATATNNNNTAANASSAHNNMQPTVLLNYIIKT